MQETYRTNSYFALWENVQTDLVNSNILGNYDEFKYKLLQFSKPAFTNWISFSQILNLLILKRYKNNVFEI